MWQPLLTWAVAAAAAAAAAGPAADAPAAPPLRRVLAGRNIPTSASAPAPNSFWLLAVAARAPASALQVRVARQLLWRPQLVLRLDVAWQALGPGMGPAWPEATAVVVGRRYALTVGQVAARAPHWAGRRRDGWRTGGSIVRGAAGWRLWTVGRGQLVLHGALGQGRPGAMPKTGPVQLRLAPRGPAGRPRAPLLVQGSLLARWHTRSGSQLWLLVQGLAAPWPGHAAGAGERALQLPAFGRSPGRGAPPRRPPARSPKLAPWRLTGGLQQPLLGGHLQLWAGARPQGLRLVAGYGRTPWAVGVDVRRSRPGGHALTLNLGLRRGAARAGVRAAFQGSCPAKTAPGAKRLAAHLALPLGRPTRLLRYDIQVAPPSRRARAAPGAAPRMWLSLRWRPAVAPERLAWQGAVGWLGPERALAARAQAVAQLGPMTVRARLSLRSTHLLSVAVEGLFRL